MFKKYGIGILSLNVRTCFNRHLVYRVRVTVQRSRKSWRTCVKPRRRWTNRGRKERRRFDAVGSCHSVLTLSAEIAALCSKFMYLIKFITTQNPENSFYTVVPCYSHGVNTYSCWTWMFYEDTWADLGANWDFCSHCSSLFYSYYIFFTVLTNIRWNYFNWMMGSIFKHKRWVCDQKGTLTFFTTKKLKFKVCFHI